MPPGCSTRAGARVTVPGVDPVAHGVTPLADQARSNFASAHYDGVTVPAPARCPARPSPAMSVPAATPRPPAPARLPAPPATPPAAHDGLNGPPRRRTHLAANSAPRRNWRTPHARDWAAYTPRPTAS